MFNSESVQKVIVGSVMIVSMVSIVMLIGSFNSYARANIQRGVASFTQQDVLDGASVIGAQIQLADWITEEPELN